VAGAELKGGILFTWWGGVGARLTEGLEESGEAQDMEGAGSGNVLLTGGRGGTVGN